MLNIYKVLVGACQCSTDLVYHRPSYAIAFCCILFVYFFWSMSKFLSCRWLNKETNITQKWKLSVEAARQDLNGRNVLKSYQVRGYGHGHQIWETELKPGTKSSKNGWTVRFRHSRVALIGLQYYLKRFCPKSKTWGDQTVSISMRISRGEPQFSLP